MLRPAKAATKGRAAACVFFLLAAAHAVAAQGDAPRVLSGVVVTAAGELVPGVSVAVASPPHGGLKTVSDSEGRFSLALPGGAIRLELSGENIAPDETQNYFASRLRPGDEPAARIHATPGHPFAVTVGLTLKFFGK